MRGSREGGSREGGKSTLDPVVVHDRQYVHDACGCLSCLLVSEPSDSNRHKGNGYSPGKMVGREGGCPASEGQHHSGEPCHPDHNTTDHGSKKSLGDTNGGGVVAQVTRSQSSSLLNAELVNKVVMNFLRMLR